MLLDKYKVIFLDRDGVINIDKHYVHKIEDFEFYENIFDICKYFQELGYEIIIITNQSGIGRKYFTQSDFSKLTKWMLDKFRVHGLEILDLFYCPHTPEYNCNCRKPKSGMVLEACKKYDIDLKKSWVIGDKVTDIDLAYNSGIKNSILISNQYLFDKDTLKTNHIIKDVIESKNIIKA